MLLKRLYLQGFKSFARPTTFLFGTGISAIIGPNGTGKTNVVDAIRWVLGDQRSSLLRTPRAEEVLFTGTEHRGPVGMAEVTMIFTAESEASVGAPAEVDVTRRLFRSGEGAYELNHRHIRLRDLWALLRHHGIGPTTYAIIGQGMIDALLRLRPHERRPLLEEAADITRYLVQMDEAEAKIAATTQNVLRLTDLLGELSPRLVSLKRQRDRLLQREGLAQSLHRLQERWYTLQWCQGEKERAQQQAALQQVSTELREAQSRQRSLREVSAGLKRQGQELEGKRARWQREVLRQDNARDDLERRRRLNAQRWSELKEQEGKLQEELRDLEAERLAEESTHAEALRCVAERRQELRDLEERRVALQLRLQDHERRSQEVRKEWLAAQVAWEEHEAERQQKERHYQRLQQHLAHVENEYEKVAHRLAALLPELRELQSSLQGLQQTLGELREAEGKAKAAHTGARQTLDAEQKALYRVQKTHDQLRERRKEILGELRRLESQKRAPLGRFEERKDQEEYGILGVVAQLLEVPPPLEKAIAAALEDTLEGIVLRGWPEAQVLLQRLDGSDGARTSLILLDLVSPNGALPEVHHEAVLGVASELIDCEEAYRPLLRALLGSTLLVKDLATARLVVQRYRTSAVTLGGEVLHATGVLRVGGWNNTDSVPFLRRPRRLLTEQLEDIGKRLSSQQRELEEARKRMEALHTEAGRQQEEATSITSRLQQVQERFLEMRRTLELKEREVGWLRAQAEDLDKERAQVREEIAAFEGEDVKGLPPVASATLATLRQKLARAEEEEQGLRRALQEVEAARATAEGALNAEEKLAASRGQGERRLQNMAATRQARLRTMEEEMARLARVLAQQEEEARQLDASSQEAQRHLAAAETEMEGLNQQLAQTEREAEVLQQHILDLERRALQKELELRSSAETLARLRREAETEGMALGAFPAGEQACDDLSGLAASSLQAKIDRLRQRLQALGAVSPEVAQEYQEAQERHAFLSAQLHDVQATLEKLCGSEAELQRAAKEAFRETFTRLSLAFDRSFQSFFDGGSAQLVLSQRDGEEGVEILARLPGRRTSSLNALSGGERALTALAFLFALLAVHPVPFCILDEVDAALDEANAQRFAHALRQFSANTQFIVVTHNRTTIQAADRLYGISMGADGVSQVLSLALPVEA